VVVAVGDRAYLVAVVLAVQVVIVLLLLVSPLVAEVL
jgi:hypothetical protein